MHLLAIIIGKLSKALLKLVKRGGSFPGELALRLDPKFLKKLNYPQNIVLVTGTNGKSTVTNLSYHILKKGGKQVICNLTGDNMKVGATSLILGNMDFFGNVKGDVLLLEVDELSMPRIMEDITPNYIVVNNFFRDQLDRAGEMENIVRKIEGCLDGYKGTLLLNGDDPSVARLALSAPEAQIIYYGFEHYGEGLSNQDEASEGRFCPICSKELKYEYYQYSHIGRFNCSDHFGNYDIKYLGKVDDLSKGQYFVNGELFESNYRALYAFYNELATIALAEEFRVETSKIREAIINFKMNNGRMEHYQLLSEKDCILNLAKNPAGVNESLKFIINADKPCVVGLVLNDLEADGQDVSWIYDAQIEILCHENIMKVVTCGTRYLDMALRVEYAGYQGKIVPISDLDEFVSYINKTNQDAYVVANYTSLQPTRGALRKGSLCVK